MQLKPIIPLAQPVLTEQEANQQRTSINTQSTPLPWEHGKTAEATVPMGKASAYKHFGLKSLIFNYTLPTEHDI